MVACITMLIGLLVIALPVIIIGGNFDEVYTDFRRGQIRKNRARDLEIDSKINSVPYHRVEDYFKHINEYINSACSTPNEKVQFFNEQDISYFIEEGFDTQEKVISLLESGATGLHFFPPEIPTYKKYVLFKVFGRKYRGTMPQDPFMRIRKELLKKTATYD